jgi:hypothetical protein
LAAISGGGSPGDPGALPALIGHRSSQSAGVKQGCRSYPIALPEQK